MEDLRLQHDARTVAQWMDAEEASNRPRLRELWVLHSEWSTAEWVRQVNHDKGVAPSSQKVWLQCRSFLMAAPATLGLQSRLQKSELAVRLWAWRWRQRWSASLGTLPLGDVDSVDVLRDKVVASGLRLFSS